MANDTAEIVVKWLDLAPCPPPWAPQLLYNVKCNVNLSEEEVGEIARRCKVPPLAQLLTQGPSDPPEVWLYIPVFVALTGLTLLIGGLVYRYLHNKHRTGDSCIQTSLSKRTQLQEEMKERTSSGCDNQAYKSSNQDLQNKPFCPNNGDLVLTG